MLRCAGLRILLLLTVTLPASAALLWNWQYSAPGIAASGTFVTGSAPEPGGGFLIVSISGTRNGDTIVALQPTGTPIPGNKPFAVDNLIFRGPGPQLTKNGFGFATSAGNYSNPFYADFLPEPGYLEFYSMPGSGTSEVPIVFSAAPVPEPASVLLALCGLACFAWKKTRHRR